MWRSECTAISNGTRYELWQEDSPLSWEQFFRLLSENQRFASWYTELLAAANFVSFFWEHPALNSTKMQDAAEFVLIDGPALSGAGADHRPFDDQFQSSDDAVLVFDNLGGDARLIVPRPTEDARSCAQLATFLRTAPAGLITTFWRVVGCTVLETLTDQNLWLSTSGLGVPWLHVRLDSVPKYYQHLPYRTESR